MPLSRENFVEKSGHAQPDRVPWFNQARGAQLPDVRAPAAAVAPLRQDEQLADARFRAALKEDLEDAPRPAAQLREPCLKGRPIHHITDSHLRAVKLGEEPLVGAILRLEHAPELR